MRPLVICVGTICLAFAGLGGFLIAPVRTPLTKQTLPSPWLNKDAIHYYAPPPELKLPQDVAIRKEPVTSSFSANPTEDLGLIFDHDLFGVHFPADCPSTYELLELGKAQQRGPDSYEREKLQLITKYKQLYDRKSKLSPSRMPTVRDPQLGSSREGVDFRVPNSSKHQVTPGT